MILIIRIILFGLLLYVGIKVISRVISLLGSASADKQGSSAERGLDANDMVRDPVCGMYVSARDALTVQRRGGTLYFCSEECRRRYTEGH
jgi:YHS domain-containing protein